MSVTKFGPESRTYQMLSKDKRVKAIKPAQYGDEQGVQIILADGWQNDGCDAGDFPDWESARNWVRKAEQRVPAE